MDINQCEGCRYWRGISGCNSEKCCHYILDTEKRKRMENGVCLSREPEARKRGKS